jgi:hypothetical protein
MMHMCIYKALKAILLLKLQRSLWGEPYMRRFTIFTHDLDDHQSQVVHAPVDARLYLGA